MGSVGVCGRGTVNRMTSCDDADVRDGRVGYVNISSNAMLKL